MGEYGLYNGNEIKIGTCEDMMYLRPEQIGRVQSRTLNDITSLLFRFPFPGEDSVEPGEFGDHTKGFPVNLEPPAEVKHNRVQFASTSPTGLLVMLPCPFSAEGKAGGITYQRNGFAGPQRVVRQRAWAGVWATVMECGGCGSMWRLPEVSDALPVCEALISEGDRRERLMGEGSGRGWHEMAIRIRKGYDTPVPAGRAG